MTDSREDHDSGVYRRIERGLGRGGKALVFALIAGFVVGLMSRLFEVDPFGPIVITYTTVYALAYLAAVLVERSEANA